MGTSCSSITLFLMTLCVFQEYGGSGDSQHQHPNVRLPQQPLSHVSADVISPSSLYCVPQEREKQKQQIRNSVLIRSRTSDTSRLEVMKQEVCVYVSHPICEAFRSWGISDMSTERKKRKKPCPVFREISKWISRPCEQRHPSSRRLCLKEMSARSRPLIFTSTSKGWTELDPLDLSLLLWSN